MDTGKNSSKPASSATIDDAMGHIEKVGGLIEHSDAARHMGALICDQIEHRFLGDGRKVDSSGYVTVMFSPTEVDRLLWLASSLSVGGDRLRDSVEEVRRALIEAGA